nr:13256_t:CDS:2 [Entrophospora candida]CAG8510461.1 1570_t:CDS:2 [Entrophospora candida]
MLVLIADPDGVEMSGNFHNLAFIPSFFKNSNSLVDYDIIVEDDDDDDASAVAIDNDFIAVVLLLDADADVDVEEVEEIIPDCCCRWIGFVIDCNDD